jgi:phospholipid/cholesterol/gamma-HCH transport system permease protein
MSKGAYEVGELTWVSVRHVGYALRRQKLLFKHLYEVGNRSLLIVSIFGLFIGLILVLHSAHQLLQFNQEKWLGLSGLPIVWEFGPVFTAFILCGRIGSAYAAEIGTMKVYDEIDALQTMGIKPEAYLATPRLLACALLMPLLVIYADCLGLLGGSLMAWLYAHVAPRHFFRVFWQYLEFDEMVHSLIKAFVFGGIIAVTGCYHGFKTTGGAEGVGRSTTQSVVRGLLTILIADYFLSKILIAIQATD